MFKKIALLTLLLFSLSAIIPAASPFFSVKKNKSSAAKLNQSSKTAVAESLLKALVKKDIDLLWKILDPEIKQQGIEECGSVAAAKKDLSDAMLKNFDSELFNKLKQVYEDASARKKVINIFCNTPNAMRKVNGKWYISGGISNAWDKVEAQPTLPDQSSKEAVCQVFAESVVNCDMSKLFAILPPELQKRILKESNNNMDTALKSLQTGFQSSMDEESLNSIKTIMADPELRKTYIETLVTLSNDRNAFVYTNGKWYIDTTKFNNLLPDKKI